MMTAGVAALAAEFQLAAWRAVRDFDDFSEDNDPYQEHDFGAFELEPVGQLFWKIDYYADATLTAGSEDPADPESSYRVLTLMLANEY